MDLSLPQLITHAIGFLITVWLLKRYAWGPLLALMDERRERIAGEFKRIDDEKVKVAQLTAEYENRLKQIEADRRQKLVDAVNEGKKIAEEIKEKAHQEARELAHRSKEELQREIAKARVQFKEEMVAITLSAAEKLLHEKLDDQRHRQLIGRFIDNVEKA